MSDTPETKKQLNPWITPAAIVIAGLLIGGGLFLGGETANLPSPEYHDVSITDTDHVLGDPETATVTIIEYSDIDCPFCKRFHATAHMLYEAYEGDVALVFRHFPLDALHPDARAKAEATECVAELAGNTAFWNFIDTLFGDIDSSNTDLASLPGIAEGFGVDRVAFTTCLESGRHAAAVETQETTAEPFGISGTPYSIFLLQDDTYYTVPGAYPADLLALTVEAVKGGATANDVQGLLDLIASNTATDESVNAYIDEYLIEHLPEAEVNEEE